MPPQEQGVLVVNQRSLPSQSSKLVFQFLPWVEANNSTRAVHSSSGISLTDAQKSEAVGVGGTARVGGGSDGVGGTGVVEAEHADSRTGANKIRKSATRRIIADIYPWLSLLFYPEEKSITRGRRGRPSSCIVTGGGLDLRSGVELIDLSQHRLKLFLGQAGLRGLWKAQDHI